MILTEFSVIGTDDLVTYVLMDEASTSREVELAQRLQVALDMLEEKSSGGIDS